MEKDFRNYHIGFARVDMSEPIPTFEPTTTPSVGVEQDSILQTIYAVDSTGFPDSSAAVALQHSTDPVIREYIAKNLLYKIGGAAQTVEDADIALELSQQLGESNVDYANRITDYVARINKIGKYAPIDDRKED